MTDSSVTPFENPNPAPVARPPSGRGKPQPAAPKAAATPPATPPAAPPAAPPPAPVATLPAEPLPMVPQEASGAPVVNASPKVVVTTIEDAEPVIPAAVSHAAPNPAPAELRPLSEQTRREIAAGKAALAKYHR